MPTNLYIVKIKAFKFSKFLRPWQLNADNSRAALFCSSSPSPCCCIFIFCFVFNARLINRTTTAVV